MKIKIIMDSGREYSEEHDRATVEDFIESMYNDLPGNRGSVMKNSFMVLGDGNKILFNPTHVSSIEIIED